MTLRHPIAPAALQRGNAVPETALIMATVLLTLFGFIQVATAEFYQISADGAAFVGAHDAVARNPTAPSVADARTAIKAAFAKLVANAAGVTTTAAGKSAFETDVTTTIPGIAGFASGRSITLVSRDVEPMTGAAGSSQKLACSSGAINVGATSGASGSVAAFVVSPPASAMTTVALTGPSALVTGGGASYMATTSVTPPELAQLQSIDAKLPAALALGPTTSAAVSAALGGNVATASLSTTLLGGISKALDAQLAKAEMGTFSRTNAIAQIVASLSLSPLLVPVVTTILSGVVPLGAMLDDFGAVDTAVAALQQADAATGATPCP